MDRFRAGVRRVRAGGVGAPQRPDAAPGQRPLLADRPDRRHRSGRRHRIALRLPSLDRKRRRLGRAAHRLRLQHRADLPAGADRPQPRGLCRRREDRRPADALDRRPGEPGRLGPERRHAPDDPPGRAAGEGHARAARQRPVRGRGLARRPVALPRGRQQGRRRQADRHGAAPALSQVRRSRDHPRAVGHRPRRRHHADGFRGRVRSAAMSASASGSADGRSR